MDGLVYILEDEEGISELISCALEVANIKTKAFLTIKDFYLGLKEEIPNLALLDIMLPDGNGLEVLKDIKQKYPSIQVIMLSALGQEIDKVKGLNYGADDYISKPFGTLELTARVNAALRRTSVVSYEVDGLKIDKDSHVVTLNGSHLELNNKEFQLLTYLIENQNVVLTRERLLDAVWGYGEGETRTIDNHILRLRKLGISQIETIFGVGYKFKTK